MNYFSTKSIRYKYQLLALSFACKAPENPAAKAQAYRTLARLVGRENLHRRQLWQLLANEQQVSVDRVQESWRALHREQVVCGGLVEAKPDLWEPKTC